MEQCAKAVCEVEKESAGAEAMGRLSRAVEGLENEADRLAERLDRFLGPVAAPGNHFSSGGRAQSEFFGAINAASNRIAVCRDAIEDLLSRLEI